MPRQSLIVLIVVLCGGSIGAVAQEAHPPQTTDQGRPTHGIIRKPQPKPPADPAKPASTEPAKTEPVKPAASTEAVATAIANAVRSIEEKERKKIEAAQPQPTRSVRPAAPRVAPPRRYSVKWPTQRFEVQWAGSDDRVQLSWGAQETD
jgi:hypothetical protein